MWSIRNSGKTLNTLPLRVMVYYGSTPWNGPLNLVDMMGKVSPEIRNMVSDYKMHLVEVLRSDAEQFQNQDVKQVIEYSQAFATKDMEKVKELSNEQDVTSEAIYMIGKITKSQEAINYLMENKEREKDYNMCEFITELIQDGEVRGEARGIIETLEEMGVPKEQIVDRLIKNIQGVLW